MPVIDQFIERVKSKRFSIINLVDLRDAIRVKNAVQTFKKYSSLFSKEYKAFKETFPDLVDASEKNSEDNPDLQKVAVQRNEEIKTLTNKVARLKAQVDRKREAVRLTKQKIQFKEKAMQQTMENKDMILEYSSVLASKIKTDKNSDER
jgi:predicted nuclease with TOPRIM domain